MPEFTIRPVPVADTRPLRHRILRPHQRVGELRSSEAPEAYAVGAFSGEEMVAVGMIAPEGNRQRWRVRGMATTPEARGRGAGSAVLEALIAYARAHGASYIWCNARLPALSLYERAGFRTASERFELPDIGPHVVMEWRDAAASDALAPVAPR